MKISKPEILILSLILLTSIFSITYGVQYFNSNPDFKNDVYIFMEAARGNYNAVNHGPGWIYKDYLAIFFKPLLLFEPKEIKEQDLRDNDDLPF